MGIFLQLYVSHIIALPLQIERWSIRWLRIMSYQMTWSYLEEIVTHIFTTFLLWSWFLCIKNVSYIDGLYISDNIDCNVTVLYGTNVWNIIKYITVNKRLRTEKFWCLFMKHTSKKAKQHARFLWKYTFISIWSQYLLIQIRKWIYVITFKTITTYWNEQRGQIVRLKDLKVTIFSRRGKPLHIWKYDGFM